MRKAASVALLLAAMLGASLAAGQVLYKWVDEQGKTQYSDRLPKGFKGEVTRIETEVEKATLPPAIPPAQAPAAAPVTGKAAAADDIAAKRRTTRARLEERLERLLKDTSVALDQGRLELELALLADRTDVTEELVRLDSHFDQIERLLSSEELIGRRLDFLLQEVGREVNTVGAKSQDAELSHVVVEMKAEIERMREQVQNVE